MVVGYIAREIFRIAYRGLYRTINAQDTLINKAWSRSKFSRPIRQGVRHGAGLGAAIGYGISEFGDDIEDYGFQAPRNGKIPSSGKYSKTRNRYSTRPDRRYCYDKRYSSRR